MVYKIGQPVRREYYILSSSGIPKQVLATKIITATNNSDLTKKLIKWKKQNNIPLNKTVYAEKGYPHWVR